MFAELALRTLVATHRQWMTSGRLRFTIVDNHSTDPDLPGLQAACAETPAKWRLSRWPAAEAPVNTHGGVMLTELTERPEVWAMQGRFEWLEEHGGEGASADIWAGDPQQLRASIDEAVAGPFTGQHKTRCHPALALVANTPVFRRIAEIVGLSAGVVIAADETVGGFADTFGLASLAMRTHGLRHALSSVTVGHDHGVSYAKAASRRPDTRHSPSDRVINPSSTATGRAFVNADEKIGASWLSGGTTATEPFQRQLARDTVDVEPGDVSAGPDQRAEQAHRAETET